MQSIDIKLALSKQFIFIISLLTMGSLGIIGSLSLSFFYKTILMGLVFFYSGYLFWRYGLLRHKKSVLNLSISQKGIFVTTRSKHFWAELCGDSVVTTWVLVLRLKRENKIFKYVCVIFKDALDHQTYRQLRVALRN